MYNRFLPNRRTLAKVFTDGVMEFLNVACSQPQFLREGTTRCPCSRCKLLTFQKRDDCQLHLLKWGFMPNYYIWTSHGESYLNNEPVTVSTRPESLETNNMYRDMVYDAVGPIFSQDSCLDGVGPSNVQECETIEEEAPNPKAQQFYDLLHASDEPLYSGCTRHSKLSAVSRMLHLKSEQNMPDIHFNSWAGLINELLPDEGNKVPENFYRTKQFIDALGLPVEKIHVCINGCMLFWGDDEEAMECKFCNHPRFKVGNSKKSKLVPYQKMYYLPITPRLQRLYASEETAKHMTWHKEHVHEGDEMCHPSDGEAWKHFDHVYPNFAREPRNIRLALCADGFSPFGVSGKSYSCWPVIVTPYNLPPWMCMKTQYMFLTMVIPGPKDPGKMIDVYLQPLIAELNSLWHVGVTTYDISRKHNFNMRAMLMWTIGDFPAYGMLSGWMTAGHMACPICMERSKAFQLRYGRKTCFFDCHRQFLPQHHSYRRNKVNFLKNRVENSPPPPRLSGEQCWHRVKDIPKVTDTGGNSNPEGYLQSHNWTKKSIFWELPYWHTLLVRHNLDVMHIVKNCFDNVFNTVMDVKGKTKDTLTARYDIQAICKRNELALNPGDTKRSKATYYLNKQEQRIVYEWIRGLKFPDGHVSNLSRCVDVNESKLINIKSHDCHVFMLRLLPVAFREMLPESIWNALVEFSIFFKELCTTKLSVSKMMELEENIALILCKLERIFPPSFFNAMEHLPIHLPYEARVCGPVQYRWMYPFER